MEMSLFLNKSLNLAWTVIPLFIREGRRKRKVRNQVEQTKQVTLEDYPMKMTLLMSAE